MAHDPLLKLLMSEARLSNEELAERLNMDPSVVDATLARWEAEGTILGYQAVVNTNTVGRDDHVCAFIEVKMTPERDGGFDRLALRISQFDEVKSCHLCSGGFDLLVIVEGKTLLEVAEFVSKKLATLPAVLSTATHFQLKTYKENNFIFAMNSELERLMVSP